MKYLPNFEPARSLRAKWVVQGALCALCFALPVQPGSAQNGPHPWVPNSVGQPGLGNLDNFPPGNPAQNEKLLRTLNTDRQKSLVSDTNKLLRLANELNAEIARTAPDELTASELRKMAEIEKLAHNVKDKMSTSMLGAPAFQSPFQPSRH
ncbi:MAG TPA: hypothetical protein VGF96_08755 [Terracidiphilus sp.]